MRSSLLAPIPQSSTRTARPARRIDSATRAAGSRARPQLGHVDVLALQRQAGNRAVVQLMGAGPARQGPARQGPAAKGHAAPQGPAAGQGSSGNRQGGLTIQRHSSWEHQLIGDLTTQELATLGASRDVAESTTGKAVVGGKQFSTKSVLHVIQQEVRRLSYFAEVGPVSTTGLADKEKELKAKDKKDRVKKDPTQQNSPDWQVKLVNVPLNSGHNVLVTYGELNTLGDYFGSVDEMKKVDVNWLDRLVRGIRKSTLNQLVKLYAEVKKLKDDHRLKPGRKTAEEKAAEQLGVKDLKFRSHIKKEWLGLGQKGKDNALPIGGVMNELKLMGAGPGLGTILGKKKPNIGGDETTSYKSTLARNACHFAPESWHAWAQHHKEARVLAQAAAAEIAKAKNLATTFKQNKKNKVFDQRPLDYYEADTQVRVAKATAAKMANEALLVNGFGDHYLQDSYAAGHLINKTQIMQYYVRWLDTKKWFWDAHFDKNWRMAQNMAYEQTGISDPTQFDKSKVGKDRTINNKSVPSGINPQTVENAKLDWKTMALALGLQVPTALTPGSDSEKLFSAWQAKEFKAKIKHKDRTLSELKALGKTAGLTELQTTFAVLDLLRAGIVRFSDYGVEQAGMSLGQFYAKVKDKTSFKLRSAFIPKGQMPTKQEVADKALAVSYKEYLEFMNSSFIQKATNNLHDHFCQNGLEVFAGDQPNVHFKIYGDNNMLQKTATEGLAHSSTTAKMSQDSIQEILDGQTPTHTMDDIIKRFPDAVAWPDVNGTKMSLEDWHNKPNALEAFCADEIFPKMSDLKKMIPSKIAPGLLGSTLGQISNVHPGEAF